ncbi:MAG: (d)CMP kinase [Bacteroidia bacterium]|nr:(d)CMP kinase [Bacteroidia bacterium]
MQKVPSVIPRKIIIAIDGYSSCGKSTLAKALARALGYRHIDSGAMYRAVTLFVQQHDITMDQLHTMSENELNGMLDNIQIGFEINPATGLSEIVMNGLNVEKKIRDLKVSDMVSPLSAIPGIRHRMVKLQQQYGKQKGIVMDGRDIGTRVFRDAELKIFMTARKEVRAKRRFDELNAKGFMVSFDEVMKNIEDRDRTDTTRKESPLVQAPDAMVLDNSDMTEQEQFEFALRWVRNLMPDK